jgi:hypothetical protein
MDVGAVVAVAVLIVGTPVAWRFVTRRPRSVWVYALAGAATGGAVAFVAYSVLGLSLLVGFVAMLAMGEASRLTGIAVDRWWPDGHRA